MKKKYYPFLINFKRVQKDDLRRGAEAAGHNSITQWIENLILKALGK